MSENEMIASKEQTAQIMDQLPVISPAVNILENESEILLSADLPGVLKDDITINIDNGTMILSGVRRVQSSGVDVWQEIAEVEFRRTFAVPQSTDINKVRAEMKDGVLKLHLPKSEAAKPRQIEIQIG